MPILQFGCLYFVINMILGFLSVGVANLASDVGNLEAIGE
jgi:hypothetical protein